MEKSEVIEVVAKHSGLPSEAIRSGVGTRALKQYRRFAMYFLCHKIGMNHRQIGEYLNASTSTVSIGIARIERELMAGYYNTGDFQSILREIKMKEVA